MRTFLPSGWSPGAIGFGLADPIGRSRKTDSGWISGTTGTAGPPDSAGLAARHRNPNSNVLYCAEKSGKELPYVVFGTIFSEYGLRVRVFGTVGSLLRG